MCGLIALMVLGFFAFFGISSNMSSSMSLSMSSAVPLEPSVVQVMPATEIAPAEAEAQAEAIPVPTDAVLLSCPTVSPAQDDAMVDGYHADVLTPDDGWTFTLSEGTSKTIGTWLNNRLGAVAYMELLHYDCGLPPKAVDLYFNPDTFSILFANYDSYDFIGNCANGDQRLFLFEASDNGVDYETRYWFEPLSAQRLAMFMLTTPVSQASNITPLLDRLYPDLPNCQRARAG